MKFTRCAFILLLALCAAPAWADEIDIGLNISTYPQLVLVPGYPVYYAPDVPANYFFYEGDFWLYDADNWYRSPWYDGPWERVDPEEVPDVILQIPIRYYVAPPAFFFAWIVTEHPHWGEHWGHDWERHRRGWDRHHRHDEPAPLPDYQRHYSGERYPWAREQQHELRQRNYLYQPHDSFVPQPQQMPRTQIAPPLPTVIHPLDASRPLHRQDERAPAPGNVPRQGRLREHGKERGALAAPPGTAQRQPAARRDQGEARQQRSEGGREERRGQEQERPRDR